MKANAKNRIISDYFRLRGKKGGKSKSQSKVKAVRANLEKARSRRWPKKEKPHRQRLGKFSRSSVGSG